MFTNSTILPIFNILLVASFLLPTLTHGQTISFTFDDGLNPRTQPQASTWNQQLLTALEAADVQAMLFPTGKNVDSPEGIALVRSWGEQGHAVGSHTYSHKSFGSSQMSLETFAADILKAEKLFKPLPGWTPRLRFPYLKEGDTAAKRDGLRAWMLQHGYLPAPVSIDASDWYYNSRFLKWQKNHPEAELAPFRDVYLAHLWDRAAYYDQLAREVLGRSPAHVMLLHTNAINATFLPDVLAMFRAKGWEIVSPLKALEDALYSAKTTTLPAGESIVWSLAKQANTPGLRYPAEDGVYEEPTLKARGF